MPELALVGLLTCHKSLVAILVNVNIAHECTQWDQILPGVYLSQKLGKLTQADTKITQDWHVCELLLAVEANWYRWRSGWQWRL